MALAIALALLTTVGCGDRVPPMPPLGPAKTNAILAGPLCSGDLCQCKEDVKGKFVAGVPDDDLKRYEVRIGPTGNELRVSVGPHQIFKSNERPTECFYIDLPEGNHAVTMRAVGNPAFGANFQIRELGMGGRHWYSTFDFECSENVCSIEHLKDWRNRTAKLGTKHDPCGSTKVKGIAYRTDRPPDGLHPKNLFVEATLEIYPFAPKKPPCPRR